MCQQEVAGHPAPGRDVGRGAGIERGDLEHLTWSLAHALPQFQYQFTAAEFSGIPFEIVIDLRQKGGFRDGLLPVLVLIVSRPATSNDAAPRTPATSSINSSARRPCSVNATGQTNSSTPSVAAWRIWASSSAPAAPRRSTATHGVHLDRNIHGRCRRRITQRNSHRRRRLNGRIVQQDSQSWSAY